MLERISPRRLLGASLLCSSLLLIAAAPPAPRATPSPAPSVAATTTPTPLFLSQSPEVMVYPFDVQGGIDPRIGMAIAQILAQEMIAAGGINVPPVPQSVKRPDFLDNARAAHADFYISGYVTPVGDRASVVEQVVSVDSGVILFSQTAQVAGVADVASQSLMARSEILAFVNRGNEEVQTQPSATPAPSATNGAKVPISGIGSIVDSVFKHKGGAAPKPSPTASLKPARGVIVAPVAAAGTVAPGDLDNALRELYFAMNRHFTTQITGVTDDVTQSADAICGANRDNTIATGTLEEQPAHRGRQIVFTLRVYTCFGASLEHETGKGSSIKSAVDAAAAAYATAHPDNS
jgi:hypothetical protein